MEQSDCHELFRHRKAESASDRMLFGIFSSEGFKIRVMQRWILRYHIHCRDIQ